MTDYERIKREYDLSLLQKNRLMDKVWPVGSIYMSLDATDPSVRFGGVWERIQNAFLLAASDAHPAGESGGEESHTLTGDEAPSLAFRIPHVAGYNGSYAVSGCAESTVAHNYEGAANAVHNTGWHHISAGGGQPHNNMPPYLAVYIWKRIK